MNDPLRALLQGIGLASVADWVPDLGGWLSNPKEPPPIWGIRKLPGGVQETFGGAQEAYPSTEAVRRRTRIAMRVAMARGGYRPI